MTKAEFGDFRQELREVRDLIIRLDQKIIGVEKTLKEGHERFEDHEKRIRMVEDILAQIKGSRITIALVLSGLSIVITAIGAGLKLIFRI